MIDIHDRTIKEDDFINAGLNSGIVIRKLVNLHVWTQITAENAPYLCDVMANCNVEVIREGDLLSVIANSAEASVAGVENLSGIVYTESKTLWVGERKVSDLCKKYKVFRVIPVSVSDSIKSLIKDEHLAKPKYVKPPQSAIRKVSGYTITIRGVEYEGFKKVDTWNGLACYKNHQGKVIVNDLVTNAVNDLFAEMFGDLFNLHSGEVTIVAADNVFLPALKAK